MLVAQIVIEDKRRTIEWLPLYVLLYRESTIAKDVIVCVISDVVFSGLDGADAAGAGYRLFFYHFFEKKFGFATNLL